MQPHWGWRGRGRLSIQSLQLGFHSLKTLKKAAGAQSIRNRVVQPVKLLGERVAVLLRALAVGRLCIALSVRFLREYCHELGDRIRLHEAVLQQIKDCAVKVTPLERLFLRACAKFARRRARHVIASHGGKSATTTAASQQPGKQVLLSLLLPETALLDALYARAALDLALPAFCRGPEVILHDAQLWNIGDHPIRFRV